MDLVVLWMRGGLVHMLPGSESRDLFDSFEFLIGFYLFSFRVHKKVRNRRVHRTIQSAVHMTIL